MRKAHIHHNLFGSHHITSKDVELVIMTIYSRKGPPGNFYSLSNLNLQQVWSTTQDELAAARFLHLGTLMPQSPRKLYTCAFLHRLQIPQPRP